MPLGLYAVTADARLSYREPSREKAPWCDLAATPVGTLGIASVNAGIFAATQADELWHLPLQLLAEGPVTWSLLGDAAGAVALATLGGRLFVIGRDGFIWTRMPVTGPAEWERLHDAGGGHTLTGWAGMLIVAAADQLRWRPPGC